MYSVEGTSPFRKAGRTCSVRCARVPWTISLVVGQIGQSLDGRIATESGHSKYINGPAGLVHLHRLRALVDAVVVGVGTAIADDPQLTVRRVAGPQPARVVIDPKGRLRARSQGVRRRWCSAPVDHRAGHALRTAPGRRDCRIARGRWANRSRGDSCRAGRLRHAPDADRRRRRYRIALSCGRMPRPTARDGRADHPGRGGPGLMLPPLERADQAPRMPVRVHQIEDDVLFDCDLSAQRVAIGIAKKST